MSNFRPMMIGKVLPLTRADIASLIEAPLNRTQASIAKLRQSHHHIARYAAYALDHAKIAALTGYSENRICTLLQAPAVQELVALYRARIEESQAPNLDAYLEAKTRNMLAAERHISDHIEELDEAGELLPLKTALAISADGADRLGYSKRQVINHNHEFASQLEKAIARSRRANAVEAPPIVDVTPSSSARREVARRPTFTAHEPALLESRTPFKRRA